MELFPMVEHIVNPHIMATMNYATMPTIKALMEAAVETVVEPDVVA
jgi:hypothetical protein